MLISFLLVGCYTILKHPITSEEGGSSSAHHQEYYRDRCLECHTDYGSYPYGFFYGEYPDYYFEYPRLGYYYAYPWWWDHYWYDDDVRRVDENGNPIEPGERAGRRGSLAPPYVGGAPAVPSTGGTYIAPGAGATKGGGTPGTGAGIPQGDKVRVTPSNNPADSTAGANSPKPEPGKKAPRRGTIKP